MGNKPRMAAVVAVLLVVGAVLALRWAPWQDEGPGPGFISGNGRIEATEIAVATRTSAASATSSVAIR